jgi:predicted ATPase
VDDLPIASCACQTANSSQALATEGDRLGADRPLPATVQALLAARLDRLGPGERAVLERAAVIGRDFTTDHVTTLLDPEAVPTAARHLVSLQRRGFVRGTVAGDLRFRHALVQEATYRATPKTLRATLHERFADALDRADDASDVLVGYHLERAYHLRAELGPLDRAARRLAEDAGRRLGAAGIRAWQREDTPAATSLLGRATVLLPESDHARLELLCELGTAFKWELDGARAEATLELAAERASRAGERGLELRAHLERAWPRFLRGAITADEMTALAEESIRVYEARDDDRGLSRAWHVAAAVGLVRHRFESCADAAERALAYYEPTGYSPSGCLSMLAAALAQGPEPR